MDMQTHSRTAKQFYQREIFYLFLLIFHCLFGVYLKVTNTFFIYNTREMIKTLTLHNNDTTPRYNGVELTHGPHSIVPWCCAIIM
jgi:hypothetical protein